jgi:hypothetical protein
MHELDALRAGMHRSHNPLPSTSSQIALDRRRQMNLAATWGRDGKIPVCGHQQIELNEKEDLCLSDYYSRELRIARAFG